MTKTFDIDVTMTTEMMDCLSHTSMASFYHLQTDRFEEITKSANAPDIDTITFQGDFVLYWGDNPMLHHLFLRSLIQLGHCVYWLNDLHSPDDWCVMTDWHSTNHRNHMQKDATNAKAD